VRRLGVMACLAAVVLAAPVSLAAGDNASTDTLTITPPATPSMPFALALTGTIADAGPDSITVYAIPGASTCDASLSQAQTDYSLDGQGTASVSGPGAFATTVPITINDAGTYLLCGYLATSDGTVITAPATTTTVPAACFVSSPFSVSGPSQLLAVRTGLVVVSGPYSPSAAGGIAPAATLTNSSGTLSLPVSLSPNPYTQATAEGTFAAPPVAGSPYFITLPVTLNAPDGSTCTQTITSNPITVTNSGVRAGVRMDASELREDEATLEFTGNCEDITPSAATVTLSGPGLAVRLFIPDVCKQWRDPGTTSSLLADLQVTTHRGWVRGRNTSLERAATLELWGGGGLVGSYAYAVTVKYDGKTHVFTVMTTQFAPGAAIWQGTKPYAWWCVDELQPLHIEGGRRYCLTPPDVGFITSVTG